MPKLSICIPTYNGANFLREAIDSVLAQTFGDFELILSDDQSSDHTFQIVQEYARHDPRIRPIRNDSNLGLVGNWNACVRAARTDWIKFHFQDDVLHPDCVATLLSAGENGQAFVACERDFIFDDPNPRLRDYYESHRARTRRRYAGRPILDAEMYGREIIASVCANLVGEPPVTLLHRSLFERYGLFNPLMVSRCDSEYWNRVGCNVGIHFISEPLVHFRVHGESASARHLQTRKFRIQLLDEIVELESIRARGEFRPLRELAARLGKPRFFDQAFGRRVHHAAAMASWASQEPGRDDSLAAELKRFYSDLPSARPKPLAHAAWRLAVRFGLTQPDRHLRTDDRDD